jgi:drug/metabolite transporter (DMT)-like permease
VNRQTVGALMVLSASAGFGTLAIFGKFAARVGLNVTSLLTFRFIIGTGLLWAVLWLWGHSRLLGGRQLRVALALGVLYAIFTAFFFRGLEFVPAGVAGITFYTYPVYVYVISAVARDEHLSRRRLVALAASLVGVGLIVGADVSEVDLVGVALVLVAALGYAGYITGSRAALASTDADAFAGTALVGTALSYLAFGLVSGRLVVPRGTDQWLVVLGIAVLGTTVPLFLYVLGLDRVEASVASVLGTSEPAVTVVLGVFLLGEVLTPVVAAGGALVLAGVVLVQSEHFQRAPWPGRG